MNCMVFFVVPAFVAVVVIEKILTVWYDFFQSQESWVLRLTLHGVQGVASSNPATPTIDSMKNRPRAGFLFLSVEKRI